MVYSIVTTHKVKHGIGPDTEEILISIVQVVAVSTDEAKYAYILDNAPVLRGKEATILVAPFC